MNLPSNYSTSARPDRRPHLWVYLGVLLAGVACIVLLAAKSPDDIAINLTPVGEIQTNGEHWLLFRFNAPKSRAVKIHQILTIGGDRVLLPSSTHAESFPDPKLPVHARIKTGGSKLLKVRRVGGGDWQLRIYLVVPLDFGRQSLARIKASWREKSFKPWNRTYIERGQRFIESEFVKTTETVVTPTPPPESPWWAEIFPSASNR